jgi:hypothetical protein
MNTAVIGNQGEGLALGTFPHIKCDARGDLRVILHWDNTTGLDGRDIKAGHQGLCACLV